MHENREISWTSWLVEQDRSVKAINQNADVNVQEKSDRAVVCAEQRIAQEGSSPSGARMRSAISERGGNASRAGRVAGMEKPKRAQRRKPDTAKADLEPILAAFRRAGCPSRGGIRRA